MRRVISFLALFVLPLFALSQCDVFIEPGSVEVIDNGEGVMFEFEITNNSNVPWYGDDLLMYWSLNSNSNIMSIELSDTEPDHMQPLEPGQSMTLFTPYIDLPNLPSFFPTNPSNDNPWLESMDWPFYTLPFPFNGTWTSMNLRLASCGLADGAWVYDSAGELYYGPFDSNCQNNNNDIFCDCDISLLGYNPDTYDVTIAVNSAVNCGCNYLTADNYGDCYDSGGQSSNNENIESFIFGLNVQTLDENWLSCLSPTQYHPGWVFGFGVNNWNQGWQSGDTVNATITPGSDCWSQMQDLAPNSLCLEMAIWQINLSQTADILDFPEEGWAATCGTCLNDTQQYPDIDISDNSIVWCFDEDPPDPEIEGCTDQFAVNYNSLATMDDGSCEYLIPGCTDPVACNYNSSATINDNSCEYCGPNCIWENPAICEGCTDTEALNYSETAIYDDGSCEYFSSIIDLSLDTILYEVGCDDFGPYWTPVFYLTNLGNEPITEFCIVEDILGTLAGNDTACFDAYTIFPGETYQQQWPNMYEWGVLSVRIINVNGESGQSWNDFGLDNNIGNNMYVQIITDEPECDGNTDAIPFLQNQIYECVDDEVVLTGDIQIKNIGTDTIFTYCIEIPELNYDECFNGGIYYIEPLAGQMIFNIPDIPTTLDSITIIVYDVNDELLDDTFNNILQVDFLHENAEPLCDILGCTIEEACNYNPEATVNDGSCDFESCQGCMDPEASNFDPEATINNPTLCIYDILGCTEINSTNYNPLATVDDGSCIPIICGCTVPEALNFDPEANAQCLPILEACIFELGCMDPDAANYNPDAWFDDDSCEYVTDAYAQSALLQFGCDPELGWYFVPSVNIVNNGPSTITEFSIETSVYDPNQISVLDTSLFDISILAGESYDWQGDTIFVEDFDIAIPIDLIQFYVYGVNDETLTQNNTINFEEFLIQYQECLVEGCTDTEANNYNEDANLDDGTCEYDITELTYVSSECYVDCDLSGPFYYVITTWTNTGNVDITNFCAEWDVIGGPGDQQECYNGNLIPGDTVLLSFGPYNINGSPVAWAYLQVINGVELVPQIENYETLYCYGDAEASCVYGCTDQEANNYDSTADLDDGTCTYDIFGCTDPSANNFNANATIDDGSCTFDVLGCTDPSANNYNPLANMDDGTCQYNVLGCTDPSALNYNPFANIDNGSCLYYDPCDDEYLPVHVPNVFTPNNDGINDVWQIITNSDCWLDWNVKIFNRWGNMIYEMTSPDQVWDGTVIGGDNIVSDGVYVCVIRARRTNSAAYQNTTEITVFR